MNRRRAGELGYLSGENSNACDGTIYYEAVIQLGVESDKGEGNWTFSEDNLLDLSKYVLALCTVGLDSRDSIAAVHVDVNKGRVA